MRLLQLNDNGNLSLTKNLINDIPPYAILSHTWGADEDEVDFADIQNKTYQAKKGYTKIRLCGEQAQRDGMEYFWVDTCCINKSDSSELAEAIVSMFKWYSNAVKCYAFLSDVAARKRRHDSNETQKPWDSNFRDSRWFTRGWTLQELLAPPSVEFYSKEWEYLGSKKTLEQVLQEITTIPVEALRGDPLDRFSDPERLYWVEKRATARREDRAYCLQGIFGVNVPPVYGEGEDEAFHRLKDAISQSHRRRLDKIGNSSTTCRSSHSEQHRIRTTSTQSIPILLQDRELLLNSLRFEQMTSRQSTIENALPTTCQWFLEHPAYIEWVDLIEFHPERSVLWINGKPGAGKSTLVKFAHANATRQKERPEGGIVLSYFFNARGVELERSTTGMYRSLLYQLLCEVPGLQRSFDKLGQFVSEDKSQPLVWTIEILCELLSTSIRELGQRELKCFIDALDECDEQEIQKMVLFFEDLGQIAFENGTQLRICFASRYYPTINVRGARQLRLEDEGGHIQDLVLYTQKYLHVGDSESAEELRKQVQTKANGIFMWVVLVIDILNKEFRGGRIFALQKRLEEIPERLSDLFKEILRRDTDNLNDLLLCLQWILFAKRPLSLKEYYSAAVAGLSPESMADFESGLVTTDSMERFLLNSSKGLAELTVAKTRRVQFIHESVRDFLIKDRGLCELWPELDVDVYTISHERLKQCCQSYLKIDRSADFPQGQLPAVKSRMAKNLRRKLSQKFAFLAYANQHVLYHANEAAAKTSQADFLLNFSVRLWVRINNTFKKVAVHRHTSEASLLYLLAECGYARLIRTLCDPRPVIGVRGERYQFPLFAALANGHREAVKALLAIQDNSRESLVTELVFGKTSATRKRLDPVVWALEQKHEALAVTLLASEDASRHVTGDDGKTALAFAVENDYVNVSLELLRCGVDADSCYIPTGESVLSYAAKRGQDGILRALLGQGANVEAIDQCRNTALLLAAENRHEEIVRLLLDRGANIEAVSGLGCTALLYAAKNGHEAIVRLLLDRGADAKAVGQYGNIALLYAAKNGHEEIVRLLLDRGAMTIQATDTVYFHTRVNSDARQRILSLIEQKRVNAHADE